MLFQRGFFSRPLTLRTCIIYCAQPLSGQKKPFCLFLFSTSSCFEMIHLCKEFEGWYYFWRHHWTFYMPFQFIFFATYTYTGRFKILANIGKQYCTLITSQIHALGYQTPSALHHPGTRLDRSFHAPHHILNIVSLTQCT